MITGDHPQTALAIARRIGLVTTPSARVLTGDALRHLTEAELQLALDAPEILFARVEPDQKMRIVAAFQVLAVDLGTDMVPALALGAEAGDHAAAPAPRPAAAAQRGPSLARVPLPWPDRGRRRNGGFLLRAGPAVARGPARFTQATFVRAGPVRP
jgi:magnesium-transporting ATPase (P-type)